MSDPPPEEIARALIDYLNSLTHLHPGDLPELISRTGRRLGAADTSLYLVDLSQRQMNPLGAAGEPLAVDGTIAGRAYRTEEIVVHHDGDSILLWVPLMDSTERLGVLLVVLPDGAAEPGAVELERWAAFGSLIGESVMAKSDYGDQVALTRGFADTALAAELRWGQLPPLTFTSDSVTVAGMLEPAYEIAGDTFDYSINGDEVSAAVLDAMGHGLEASRMATVAVGAYRHARRRRSALESTLLEIDRVIAEEFGDQRFVTGQLATLRISDGSLRLVNAGHPPPLHFRQGRVVGTVECRPRPPLGLGEVEATAAELALEPGDHVLLYTDGVIEARSSTGEEFGEDRLADLVSRSLRAGVKPSEVLRRVVQAVYGHTGPELQDDASLVLLGWHGA